MRPIRDLFLIKADKEANTKIKHNSLELEFNPLWDKYKNAVRVGEIVYSPLKVDKPFLYDLKLFPGDKIYFHHFVVQPDNIIKHEDQELYVCHYQHIYCVVRDGKIIPVEDHCLLSPVLEPIENYQSPSGLILKPVRDKLEMQGKIEHLSEQAKEAGLNIGDIVQFERNSDLELEVEGIKYYCMRLVQIQGILI